MSETALQTYLRAQGELGGFEIMLSEKLPELKLSEQIEKPIYNALPNTGYTYSPKPIEKPALQNKTQTLNPPPSIKNLAASQENNSLWQEANNLNDFYAALQKHFIYTKSMRSLSFYFPKETKINAPYFLIFHSPLELTAAAKEILERLFKKLNIDLNTCAISFFFKCNEAVLTREKSILRDMLFKEIKLINPEKIIFFREAPRPEKIETPAKADGAPITFAGKPAITLYSLLEMLSGAAGSKEKVIETWKSHLPASGWFKPEI